jgi:hypothetical protein
MLNTVYVESLGGFRVAQALLGGGKNERKPKIWRFENYSRPQAHILLILHFT